MAPTSRIDRLIVYATSRRIVRGWWRRDGTMMTVSRPGAFSIGVVACAASAIVGNRPAAASCWRQRQVCGRRPDGSGRVSWSLRRDHRAQDAAALCGRGRAARPAAVVARLSPQGILLTHCHDGRWRPPARPRHSVAPLLEPAGVRVVPWGSAPEGEGRCAFAFTSTGQTVLLPAVFAHRPPPSRDAP